MSLSISPCVISFLAINRNCILTANGEVLYNGSDEIDTPYLRRGLRRSDHSSNSSLRHGKMGIAVQIFTLFEERENNRQFRSVARQQSDNSCPQ